MDELASIIIVIFNSKRHLESCIESILKQNYPHEIIVVDNNSTDGSCQLLRDKFPMVKLIENYDNLGYGMGNNLGIKYATGKYIVILNPDTIVENSWLREIIKPLIEGDKIITTPKILTYDGISINTCGAINHFTGLTFTRGLGATPNSYFKEELVSGFSGCSFAITKDNYQYLGGFDRNFFMYNEDADFSWRANLNDFKILFIPTSIIRHDYVLKISPEKIYHLEKGRYLILRKYLSTRYLLFLSPSLLITELLTFGYVARNGMGYIFYKILAMIRGITSRADRYEGNQQHLLMSLCDRIPEDQLSDYKFDTFIKKIFNKVYRLNFALLKVLDKQ